MDDDDHVYQRVSKAMRLISRDLRQRSTTAEALLWEYLRDRRLDGIKFRRQNPITGTTFVVDFFCRESLFAIELDGSIHDQDDQKTADLDRQRAIEETGVQVLRFRNEQVFDHLETVLASILVTHSQRLIERNPTPPAPNTSNPSN